jgi:hypothetical protein
MEIDMSNAGNDTAPISCFLGAQNITQTIELFAFVSFDVCGEEETFAA